MRLLIGLSVYAVNVVVGMLVYLDLTRRGRSPWWLLAFKIAWPVVLPAYVLTARQERRPRVQK